MAWFVDFLFSAVFEVVLYAIGRFLIPILSLGTARAEKLREPADRRHYVYQRHEGMIVFSTDATIAVGVLFLALLAVLAYVIYHA